MFLLEEEKIQYLNVKYNISTDAPAAGGGGGTSETLPTSSNAIVQAWLDKLYSDGIVMPSQERVDTYTAAWDYADAQGLTAELDLFGLLLVEHPDQATVPFIHSGGASRRFTFVGELTYSAYRGISGVISPVSYIDTNWQAFSDSVKFAEGDGSVGIFVNDFVVSNKAIMSDAFFDPNDNNNFYNTVIIPKTSIQAAVYIQYTENEGANYGGATMSSNAVTSSYGLTSGTLKDDVGQLWKDGLASGSPSAQDIASSFEFAKGNMQIFRDTLSGAETIYEGYATAFFMGSSLNTKQPQMASFINMMLVGVPNTFLLNAAGTAYQSSMTLYVNKDNTQYISTDETAFKIFSKNLTPSSGSLTVSIPANFEFYDGSTWNTGTASVSYTGGAIDSAVFKIRMTKEIAVGNYSGALTIQGGGAETASISLFGESLEASANMTTWQSGLAGALPSGKLLKGLNTFIDGVVTDGNLAAMDFFMIASGMETDEQRLRPIKTTSGSTPTLNGATPPTGTTAGFASTGTGYIDFNWVPSTNGVNFTQNNASMHSVAIISGTNRTLAGGEDPGAIGRIRIGTSIITPAGAINDGTFSTFLSGGTGTNYFAIYRTNSTTKVGYKNGTASSNISKSSNGFSSYSIFGLGYNLAGTPTSTVQAGGVTARMWFWGSNAISASQMRTRMNTYFTFMGLTTV